MWRPLRQRPARPLSPQPSLLWPIPPNPVQIQPHAIIQRRGRHPAEVLAQALVTGARVVWVTGGEVVGLLARNDAVLHTGPMTLERRQHVADRVAGALGDRVDV